MLHYLLLCKHLFLNDTCDVGKAEVSSCVAVGQFLVVETHECQQGRVQIVDVHTPFDSLSTEFIGTTIAEALLHTSPGHEHGVARDVVVAAVVVTLCSRQTSELGAEEH